MTRLLLVALVVSLPALAGCAGNGSRAEGTAWPGRLHRLPPWRSGVPALLINVPEVYAKGLRAEEAFLVHLFRRPPTSASPGTATLAVYIGLAPQEPRCEDVTEPVAIAGRRTQWVGGSWEDARGRTVHHAEAYVRGLFRWPTTWRADAHGLVIHVMAWGTDAEEVQRLMRAAESLRLEP